MVTYNAGDKQPLSLNYGIIVFNCKYGYVFHLGILFFAQPKQLCGKYIYSAHINFKSEKKLDNLSKVTIT